MLLRMHRRTMDEKGFTLIELLVVILIIGILAAIAIPSFLNQKGKASDASAKELARTTQTAAETFATDNNGSYTGMSVPGLVGIETTINTSATNKQAYVDPATGVTSTTNTYTVMSTSSPTGNTYSVSRAADGSIQRTCTVVLATNNGGCVGGAW